MTDHDVPAPVVESLREPDRLEWADVVAACEGYDVGVEDLVEVDDLRQAVVRAYARRDREVHRTVYDELADS
jgi:hypothetical protein